MAKLEEREENHNGKNMKSANRTNTEDAIRSQGEASKSEEQLNEEAVEALSSAINVRDSNVDEC